MKRIEDEAGLKRFLASSSAADFMAFILSLNASITGEGPHRRMKRKGGGRTNRAGGRQQRKAKRHRAEAKDCDQVVAGQPTAWHMLQW